MAAQWFSSLWDSLGQAQSQLEAIAALVTLITVPAAAVTFLWEKRRERLDREYGTYLGLSDKYIEFLHLCFAHPDLDVWENHIEDCYLPLLETKDPVVVKKEVVAYTIFVTMCEQAYLVYRQHSSEVRRRQWEGWLDYLRDYCRHESFRKAWPIVGRQFDTDFTALVSQLMKETASTVSQTQAS